MRTSLLRFPLHSFASCCCVDLKLSSEDRSVSKPSPVVPVLYPILDLLRLREFQDNIS